MKLSPQKEIIVAALRDLRWHCGRQWIDRIKDDRIRITELNRGYMAEFGYHIVGKPCRGKACGNARCPLYMRRAEKLQLSPLASQRSPVTSEQQGRLTLT